MSLPDYLDQSAVAVAKRLLGCVFVRELDNSKICVRIVETEAYTQTDAASHSYHGRTPRTDVMFGPSGVLYVYFTYGMHYCMNVVCGPKGSGEAVLIRAVEPVGNTSVLEKYRGGRQGVELTNGPAKLCQALAIDKTYNGHDVLQPPLRLQSAELKPGETVVQTTRIGIRKAVDLPRRFYIAGNPYVSKP